MANNNALTQIPSRAFNGLPNLRSLYGFLRIYLCMYVYVYVTRACGGLPNLRSLYGSLRVCIYVCMYVCMYIYVYVYIYIYI
jgi:hypothetical protein